MADEKKRKFRCPKGHEWEDAEQFSVFCPNEQDYGSGALCPYCYVDWHAQMFPAEEVKDA